MTIGELARKTGVTIRALRHYDRIGLLKPAQVTQAGYRLYDETALTRLHAILMFREVELPLEDIRRILDDPSCDARRMLELQQTLLTMRREHVSLLLEQTKALLEKGMTDMDFPHLTVSRHRITHARHRLPGERLQPGRNMPSAKRAASLETAPVQASS